MRSVAAVVRTAPGIPPMTADEVDTTPHETPVWYVSPGLHVVPAVVRETAIAGVFATYLPFVHRGVKQWRRVPSHRCYLDAAAARAALRANLLKRLAVLDAADGVTEK